MIPIKGPEEPQQDRRKATPIGDTSAVPEGTMVTVPAAAPTGGTGTAPVVAVNTVSKWSDPVFLLSILTALTGVATSVISVLPQDGPIDWRKTSPAIIMAILGSLSSFFRTRINSVTK